VFLACALLGSARAENVVLFLKNGDRITGFVVSEYTNRLVLSNSWANALSVPLKEIDRREIAFAGTNHMARTNVLAVKLKPPTAPPPLFKHWKGQAEVGLDLIYSTVDQRNYHARLQLAYEKPYKSNPKNFFRNTLDYSVLYGKTIQHGRGTNLTTTSSDQMGVSDKTSADFDGHWYGYNLVGAGFDRVRGIDLHIEEGPGLGYHLVTRTNLTVNLEGGANYQIQDQSDGTHNRDFFFRLAEDVNWKLSPRTIWSEKVEFFPRVNFGEYRLRAETTLSYNLWRYVYLNTTVQDAYDTEPAVGAQANELQVHSALGVKF